MGFILSKLLWVFFAPGNILVLLLLLGAFLVMARNAGWQELGRKLCFNIAFLLFFLAVFPVGDWMLLPLENRFPAETPSHVDGIIMLGGDERPAISEARNQPTSFDSARRYITFVSLARTYPDAKLVYTGGSGLLTPEARMKDADVAKQTLASLGVPVERVTFEDASRNTHENATLTADIIHPTSAQNWLLVTSAWHMPRSIGCFRHVGWNVMAAPTGYMTTGQLSSKLQFNLPDHLQKITLALHEYYGLIAYRLLGYTDSVWPG